MAEGNHDNSVSNRVRQVFTFIVYGLAVIIRALIGSQVDRRYPTVYRDHRRSHDVSSLRGRNDTDSFR